MKNIQKQTWLLKTKNLKTNFNFSQKHEIIRSADITNNLQKNIKTLNLSHSFMSTFFK